MRLVLLVGNYASRWHLKNRAAQMDPDEFNAEEYDDLHEEPLRQRIVDELVAIYEGKEAQAGGEHRDQQSVHGRYPSVTRLWFAVNTGQMIA